MKLKKNLVIIARSSWTRYKIFHKFAFWYIPLPPKCERNKKISICRQNTFGVIFEKLQTKGNQLSFKYEKVWWEPVTIMFTCAERKDQANQIYNSGLAFISISSTFRSIPSWLWMDYTAPKVLSQIFRWATIASIYWYNSGWKRAWRSRYWHRWRCHILIFINLCVSKIAEKLCEKWRNFKSS